MPLVMPSTHSSIESLISTGRQIFSLAFFSGTRMDDVRLIWTFQSASEEQSLEMHITAENLRILMQGIFI